MEKSVIDLMSGVRDAFELPEVDMRTYSPLTLAYIGDAVYDLIIRSYLVGQGNAHSNKLHRKAVSLVNAGAQSASIARIKDALTEEELHVFKRGRNACPASTAKHAAASDYHRATGFEALIGYLYLCGDTDRILELIKMGLDEEI